MRSTTTPRRVLMTADTVGGVFSYAVELCRGLVDHGVGVTLATMGAPLSDKQRQDLRAVGAIDVRESAYRLEWMDAPWEDVARAASWLMELEREVKPDLVHLNQFAFGTLGFRAPKLVVGHSCVFSWCEAVQGQPPSAQFDRYRIAVADGLKAADLVVAPSAAMLDALERFYGPLPQRQVIHNARSPHQWESAQKEPVIFAAGRLWDEAKNIAQVASIAPELDWAVRIAGETKSPDGGEFRADGVTLLGTLSASEIAHEMSKAALYVFPARYEPFGLSVLEAALSGCALVLGDIPSLRELWGDAAVFVPPEARQRWVFEVGRLTADVEARQELSARARQRALRYSPERMVEAYLEAYERLGRSKV